MRILPQLAPAITGAPVSFFMQVQGPQEPTGTLLTLTEALIDGRQPSATSVILDILVSFPSAPKNEAALWKTFGAPRHTKNRVFAASITDETRELYH